MTMKNYSAFPKYQLRVIGPYYLLQLRASGPTRGGYEGVLRITQRSSIMEPNHQIV